MRNSDDFTTFCLLVHRAWRTTAGHRLIEAGLWRCTIAAHWPRRDLVLSEQLGSDIPKADTDAPLSAVLDALQRCRAIDNDARIAEVRATRHYDPREPRIEITLERIDR